jgi:dienelactone hydrolase
MRKQEVKLWPKHAPFAEESPNAAPVIDIYLPEPAVSTGFGMLVFPDEISHLNAGHTTPSYGEWFAARGVAIFVTKRQVHSRKQDMRTICANAYQALSVVRSRAQSWGLSPHQIGAMGSSVGALIAGILCTGAGQSFLKAQGLDNVVDLSLRPNFGVFCYGMLSLMDPLAHREARAHFLDQHENDRDLQQAFSPIEAVDAQCPRAFIWHTLDDTEMPAEHAKRFAHQLHAVGVPHELHLYQKGGHGLGMARAERLYWANDCLRWITL